MERERDRLRDSLAGASADAERAACAAAAFRDAAGERIPRRLSLNKALSGARHIFCRHVLQSRACCAPVLPVFSSSQTLSYLRRGVSTARDRCLAL